MKKISIIIPSKDEERTIAKCIESVENALEGVRSYEIILVDSYSSDRTLEIAKKYPIRILRLQKHWPKSPAAGRYIGTVNSTGKYVLFLDADMTLDINWINKGLEALENEKNTAGVTGVMYSYLHVQRVGEGRLIQLPFGEVSFLPGAGMYKRSVLEEVGHFNPFMKGFEERELGSRIKNKGYKQISINEVISHHFEKAQEIEELAEKAIYFTGVGQFLRIHLSLKNVMETIRRYFVVFIAQLLIFLFLFVTVFSLLFENILFIVILINFYLIMMLALALKQRNINKSYLFIYSIIAKSFYFFKGFLMNHKMINSYPLDVEVIK